MRNSIHASTAQTASTLANARQDLLSSFVVFLVALPLCMGISIASGVPVAAGLVTGIVGGIFVGLLAGAPLQVSGPAAGLTVLVLALVQQHGLASLGPAVLIAGALQLLAGLFRLGQWFRAVSPAVIYGMLAGIGVLIVASQFHVMVDEKPRASGLANLATIPEAIGKGLPMPEIRSLDERQLRMKLLQELARLQAEQSTLQADARDLAERSQGASVDATATAFQSLVNRQQSQRDRLDELSATMSQSGRLTGDDRQLSEIRDATAAALAAAETALQELRTGDVREAADSQGAAAAALTGTLSSLKDHQWAAKLGLLTIAAILLWQGFARGRLRMIPAPLVAVFLASLAAGLACLPVLYVGVPDNLLDDLHPVSWNGFMQLDRLAVLQAGLVLAAVASAETLLCATAVDRMHNGPRTRYDRELCAQGAGNMLCGALGALPMTGVIVRSAANVQSGARSRLSAILHGCWLLVFVVLLAHVLRRIPTASLAAMLVYTGYKLINPKAVRELWKVGKSEVLIYGATVGTIVAVDLLTGVLTGIVLSAVKLLLTFSRLNVQLSVEQTRRTATLKLRGAATFLRLPRLATLLEQVPPSAELHVDFGQLNYIDHACLELLMSWARQHEATGGTLVIDWDSLHARFRKHVVPETGGKTGSLAA